MSFDKMYRDGIERVWDIDASSQNGYLRIIQDARNMSGMNFRKINACFIPNDRYFLNYFGEDAKDPAYGIYDESNVCFWNNCLVFPIYNVADQVVSLAGFNPLQYVQVKETGDRELNYYVYSPKSVFSKRRYLFYTEGTYFSAMADGYLFLTDGIFDTLMLAQNGFWSAALMGSSLTPEIIMQLRFIKRVILLADNDLAGVKLYRFAKKYLKNVVLAKQGITKDVDELLKGNKKEAALRWLKTIAYSEKSKYATWVFN